MASDAFGRLVTSPIQIIRSYASTTHDCTCDAIFETLTCISCVRAAHLSIADFPECVRLEMIDSFAQILFARSSGDVGFLMISMLSIVDLQLACVNKSTLQLHNLCVGIYTFLLARLNVPFSPLQELQFQRIESSFLPGASSNVMRWKRVQFYIVWWLQTKTASSGQKMCLLTVRHLFHAMHADGLTRHNNSLAILYDLYSSWFDIELPDKRYWLHWVAWIERDVSVRQSNASRNECTSEHAPKIFLPDVTLSRFVYMFVSFSVYISRVCPSCASTLADYNYRIHPQHGIQTRVAGGVWMPDLDAL
jgi:hypothetical protein